jgi:Raf kinase inhibitor-like YbhB/YbcL family protein
MRRWQGAAALLLWLAVGCTPAPPPADTPLPTPVRPTPSGPTPTLPLARAIASPSASAGPGNSVASGGFQSFALQSPAFSDGAQLPGDFTCDGLGESPPLMWSGAPPGSAAYALVVQDMDVKATNSAEPFTSWLLYNMPRLVTQLSAGVPPRPLLTNGSQQGLNDNQTVGYATPCPKPGDGPHHFTFQLFAQDGYVTLETAAPPDAVRDALNGHTLGEAKLTAIVQR